LLKDNGVTVMVDLSVSHKFGRVSREMTQRVQMMRSVIAIVKAFLVVGTVYKGDGVTKTPAKRIVPFNERVLHPVTLHHTKSDNIKGKDKGKECSNEIDFRGKQDNSQKRSNLIKGNHSCSIAVSLLREKVCQFKHDKKVESEKVLQEMGKLVSLEKQSTAQVFQPIVRYMMHLQVMPVVGVGSLSKEGPQSQRDP
jgi:hypothetical protein